MATLENQIAAFFDRVPDEELTSQDVRIKFSVNETTAKRVLKQMHEAGRLERERIKGRTAMVYRTRISDHADKT